MNVLSAAGAAECAAEFVACRAMDDGETARATAGVVAGGAADAAAVVMTAFVAVVATSARDSAQLPVSGKEEKINATPTRALNTWRENLLKPSIIPRPFRFDHASILSASLPLAFFIKPGKIVPNGRP